MKITLVRHLKVDLVYEDKYDSQGFNKSQEDYDNADIIEYRGIVAREFEGPVYVSDLKRTHLTLMKKFKVKDYTISPLIREVPLKAFKESTKLYKKTFWQVIGRISWFLNLKSQGEGLRDTVKRANEFIDLLERKHPKDHVLVISHGVFMKVLSFLLVKRAYKGKYIFGLAKNGEEFTYTKDLTLNKGV